MLQCLQSDFSLQTKEDSLLLVATDIDMPQGQEVILTTDEETHYAEEYLKVKKERLQSVEDID